MKKKRRFYFLKKGKEKIYVPTCTMWFELAISLIKPADWLADAQVVLSQTKLWPVQVEQRVNASRLPMSP